MISNSESSCSLCRRRGGTHRINSVLSAFFSSRRLILARVQLIRRTIADIMTEWCRLDRGERELAWICLSSANWWTPRPVRTCTSRDFYEQHSFFLYSVVSIYRSVLNNKSQINNIVPSGTWRRCQHLRAYSEWVSESIVNGTSAQLGHIAPFTSVHAGKYRTADKDKTKQTHYKTKHNT